MEAVRMRKKMLVIVLAVTLAAAVYTFSVRGSPGSGLKEKLAVDDITHSRAYGWVFAKNENYNGEFVLYVEGLHRVVFAAPARTETNVSGKPDVVIKMGKELRIYGNILVYGGRQYMILEYGSYALPPWASEALLSGEVKAFTNLGRELTDIAYDSFPVLDAVTLFRTSPLTVSPYANYFIEVTECRVYDNTVEYLLGGGGRVVFSADTMEYAFSTDPEIDRAYREGGPDYSRQ
jgi:hypothetical protein